MKKSVFKQAGFSLVELLVALFVGTLILSGVLQIVMGSGQSFRIQESVMRMQESGQFAVEHLLRDLRNTGFMGCLTNVNLITNQLNTGSPFLTFTANMEGSENEDGTGSALAGTDTITLRGMTMVLGGLSLQAPLPVTTADLLMLGPNSGIVANDILFVSNCEAGDIFQVTSINAAGAVGHLAGVGAPGNISSNLSTIYNAQTFAYVPYTRLYDVRNGTNGIPSLFMTDSTGSQELVQGVESMVILYGEDTDADGVANRYVRANSVTNMDNVVSVRISLLLRTELDSLSPTPVQYTFNQQTITPTDNRLRRVYTNTVMLRNRGS